MYDFKRNSLPVKRLWLERCLNYMKMANKQPNPKKSADDLHNNVITQKVTVVQNGNSDETDHVNGLTELATDDVENDFHQLSIDEEDKEIHFNPNQNGVCLLQHNHGETSSGAIPKCPIFRKLKKQYSGDKHKDKPCIVNGSCDSVPKPSKKYKKHNSACCDIFCSHSYNTNLNDEDGMFSVYGLKDKSPGWNDVNGGGIDGFINPNMQTSQEADNGLERNCFFESEHVNVHEVLEVEENLEQLTNGGISHDISDGGLSEMIDEGAVCDFDRLQHLEYEEMYEVDNLEIEDDHNFDELESPDLFPYLSVDRCKSTSNICHPQLNSPRHNSFSNQFVQHNNDGIGAAAQSVSVHCYRTVRCDDHVIQDSNTEDNGDFIDTDLPSKASGPNSSESLSGSDDEITQDTFDNIAPDPRNDLSSNGPSYSFVNTRGGCSPPFDAKENCLVANRGSNFDKNKDGSLYPSDKLHLIGHDESDNSSESENDDNVDEGLFEPCVLRYDEFLSSEQFMASSNHPRDAVGHSRSACFDEQIDDHGMNASGGAFFCEKVSNSLMHPGCRCPVVNSSCTAQSNANIVKNSGSENSNLQNDESNKKQKIFNKFPILSSRQSCGSQTPCNCNKLSCDKEPNLPHVSIESSDMSSYTQQSPHVSLASNCEHMPVTSECGVSEPIYEDINEGTCSEQSEDNSKMGASGGFTEKYKKNIDSEPKPIQPPLSRQRERKTSSGSTSSRGHVEKVMIWSEYEAYIQQVKQIGLSACGPTAVINVLKALDMNIDKEEVSRVIRAKLRMEDAPIPLYLFSRAVAGTEATDLLQGVETLTRGKLRGRFFKFWPARDVHLVKWLGHWMKKGAVPLATLNLQRGVGNNQPIPDAWHHQMVYGVSSKDIYLTNPQEKVREEIIMEQLTSDSVLLISRQDIVQRFHEDSDIDLRQLLTQSDERWCTMNVLGQVVNVLREAGLANNPGYRTQLTSHISIPAVYETGITLFVQSNTETWYELKSVDELPLREGS
ncbi:uncharacterized protein LOC126816899 isoform X1 [Patella vulgata]|uniref:uncharacterized protein LOC126816899 isoform X1 n=2 Tax=Patella vulgata TaxID=6465 RepID=UPI0024A8B758|nr:uncharacterized protein LOC126816899 isoform X1 [Patella vulgata]